MVLLQRTIRQSVRAVGIGLHSGKKVQLVLRPAPVDHGIVFCRMDLPAHPSVLAFGDQVYDTRLSTCLRQGEVEVHTVEHLMSALAGLGVDNLLVELSAPEVPIMDGSAVPFLYLLHQAQVVEQSAPKRFIRIKRPITVQQGQKWARLEPNDGFSVDFAIDFPHPALGQQSCQVALDFSPEAYIREISSARTFGFMQEVEWMRAQGLALGGSLSNAIVLDEFRVLNQEGLRQENELVRHKILDAIGDFYLLGRPLLANLVAYKSGHALNNALVREVLAHPEAWEEVVWPTDKTQVDFSTLTVGQANSVQPAF